MRDGRAALVWEQIVCISPVRERICCSRVRGGDDKWISLVTAKQPAFSISAAIRRLCSSRQAVTSADAPSAYPARIAACFALLQPAATYSRTKAARSGLSVDFGQAPAVSDAVASAGSLRQHHFRLRAEDRLARRHAPCYFFTAGLPTERWVFHLSTRRTDPPGHLCCAPSSDVRIFLSRHTCRAWVRPATAPTPLHFYRQHTRNLMRGCAPLVSAPSVGEKSTHPSVPRRQAFRWARRKRVRA
jgi:hypothetical protein